MRDLTQCVHHPAVPHDGYASLAVPTHRASTIVYGDAQSFAERSGRGFDGYTYGLHGTPTTRTLEAQLTALHGGTRTVLVPSGQAAVTIVISASCCRATASSSRTTSTRPCAASAPPTSRRAASITGSTTR